MFAMSGSEVVLGNPAVSIIIPYLNQPDFLGRCLASLAPQLNDENAIDVIVVDNGSAVMPTSITAQYKWARLAQELVPGPGPARNHGIALSSAPVFAFIDADCVAHPGWLAAIQAEFKQSPTTEVIGGDVRIGLADAQNPTALEAYESVFAYRQKEYIEKIGFSGTGNLAMRRSAFEAVGPFAGISVAEDRDWGRRAQKVGLKIKYLECMIVYHPARKTFLELCKKWNRHVSHDFEELPKGWISKLKWFGLTLAVAASGVIDVRKIIASRRISSLRERVMAAWILLRIRLYRSGRMTAQLARADQLSKQWNRG